MIKLKNALMQSLFLAALTLLPISASADDDDYDDKRYENYDDDEANCPRAMRQDRDSFMQGRGSHDESHPTAHVGFRFYYGSPYYYGSYYRPNYGYGYYRPYYYGGYYPYYSYRPYYGYGYGYGW